MIELTSHASVTVAVVSADLRNAHAQKCIDQLKRHTRDFDLWILDNNNFTEFNHAREMNKVLKSVTTDFVVLMDDDVFVEPGWLPNLLRAVDEKTGLVVPMHRNAVGDVSFSGVYLMGDDFGTRAHLVDVPDAPRVAQCVCGALMLIDRRKCGNVRVSEEYAKYGLDIDYSLQIWEAGYQVVCTPDVTVTHVGGGTAPAGSEKSRRFWNADMPVFIRRWIDSGRFDRLATEAWSNHPALVAQCAIPQRIRRVTEDQVGCGLASFERELQTCLELSAPYPLFRSLLLIGVRQHLRRCRAQNQSSKISICERMLQQLEGTIEVHGGPSPEIVDTLPGYNLVEFGKEYLGIPQALGPVDVFDSESRKLPGLLIAESLPALRAMVDSHSRVVATPIAPLPKLVDTHRRYNLIEFDNKFVAVPLELGPVDLCESECRKLPGLLIADSMPALRALVDAQPLSAKATIDPSPRLIETHHGYNLVEFGTEFLAVPLELGPVDLRESDSRKLPGLLVADSLPALRVLLDTHQPGILGRLLGISARPSRRVAKACRRTAAFGLRFFG